MNEPQINRSDKPVALFGATGVTGKLIVEEFHRANLDLRIVGRNEIELRRLSKETGFDFRVIDLNRLDSIKQAMSGAAVVINCVGPFNLYGDAVIESACDLAIHYIDTTGEQTFIERTASRCDRRAKEKGIAVAPSCAFEYAVSDALVDLALANTDRFYDIEIYYLIEGSATSVGTRKSLFHQLSQPFLRYESGALRAIEPLHFFKPATLPDGQKIHVTEFGSGEAVLFPLHRKTSSTRSYLATKKPPLPPFKIPGALLQGAVKAPLLKDAIKALLIAEGAPSKEALASNKASVILVARDGEAVRTSIAESKDPYALTAVIATAIAEKLKNDGPDRTGFCSPSMVAGGHYIKDRTKSRGIEWSV